MEGEEDVEKHLPLCVDNSTQFRLKFLEKRPDSSPPSCSSSDRVRAGVGTTFKAVYKSAASAVFSTSSFPEN